MLAYIDENGNLSPVPPDPKKKKVINTEDIQIGTMRQVVETIRTGTVTFFNEAKGYGFIKDNETQEGVFVHINVLSAPLKENDKVKFETERGVKGVSAINVELLK